jgi:hypothetical protein
MSALSNEQIKAVRAEIDRANLISEGNRLIEAINHFQVTCAGNDVLDKETLLGFSTARDSVFKALIKHHDACEKQYETDEVEKCQT